MRKARTMALCGAACVAALVLGSSARADIAMPRARWTTVQMAAEEVNIALSANRVAVEATFQMQNTGKAGDVVIGYPVGVFETELKDFAVTADQKPVADVRTESNPAGKAGGEPYRFEGPYKNWKVFSVPFAENEKKAIRVTYSVEPAQIKAEGSAAPLLHYCYTLKTGATWKGNIGEAVIRVKLDGVQPAQLARVTPAGFEKSQDGKALTWTMKDFKPTDDIEITYTATN